MSGVCWPEETIDSASLRVNPMRSTPDAVVEELRAAGIDVEPGPLVPEALLVSIDVKDARFD